MIKVEKNLGHHSIEREANDELVLSYEQRTKGRLRVASEGGKTFGLFLERGKLLHEGDILEAEDGQLVRVRAQVESLIEGRCGDWLTFSRCCYHLGNRHVPVEIGEKFLRIQSDHILKDMLSQLGMEVSACNAPFVPEQGAYSGGHHHHHEH